MRHERHHPLNLSIETGPVEGEPPEAQAEEMEALIEPPVRKPSRSHAAFLPPLPPAPQGMTPYLAEGPPKSPKAKPAPLKTVRKKPVEMSAPPAPKAEPTLNPPRSPARFAYWIAGVCAVAWAGAFIAFVAGFGKLGPFDYAPFRDVVVAALAVLPALFMLLFAYALRQGARLGEDVRATRRLSEDLVGPIAVSAAQTGELMRAMRGEIEQAAQAAEAAERRLAALRETLSDENRRLTEAAQDAQAGARTLGEALGHERGELEALSSALEARTAEITQAVARQTKLAADVSDLAQVQLVEAQASLAARAADLSAAAADVRDGAQAAAELLSQQSERMDLTGVALTQRLTALGAELTRERDQLVKLTDGLKIDHEDLSARAESQHARLAAFAQQTRADSEAADLSAGQAADTLRGLIAETVTQIRGVNDVAAEARRTAAAEAQASLETLSSAAEQAQAAAAARLAQLEEQAQTLGASALQRIEQLGEAAFSAGQRADQAFDARIGAAKRAIDQSAAAVEEAGLRSAQRIEAGLAGARAALTELDALLDEVDGRFAKLPEEARERADALRSAVQQGVGDLTAAARRAAEETTAIDEAFQERVRRNYDTLSEAVRLMGRVAGAVDAAARAPEAEIPLAAEAPGAKVHALDLMTQARDAIAAQGAAAERQAPGLIPQPLPLAVGDSHARFTDLTAPIVSAPTASRTGGAESFQVNETGLSWRDLGAGADLFDAPNPQPATQSAEELGLRPRLKLTATPETPAAPILVDSAVQASTMAAATVGGWSWKDLLSTLPEEAAVAADEDEEALADRLVGEIEALGLDVAALLPRAQVEEIAHGLQSGRGLGARDGVRRLAPAAVRRLSRRVLTDAVLRREADRFVRRYAALVDDAVRRDADGFLASALLGSDAGRAFLMLDAAIGDLAH